jgi:predicted metal-dependent HD superfamily phosphohydrolase
VAEELGLGRAGRLAALFHDVVYWIPPTAVPTGGSVEALHGIAADGTVVDDPDLRHEAAMSNEAASASMWRRVADVTGVSADEKLTRKVEEAIVATEGHAIRPGTLDEAFVGSFLDADLATLAADAATYDAYARNIRAEYGHFDDEQYRVGRSRVMRTFLERDVLYFTPALAADWTRRAHANVARELDALAADG